MTNYALRLLLSCLFCLLLSLGWDNLPAKATGIYDLPTLTVGDSTYLIDDADAISISNEGTLTNNFKQLAQNTGTEVRMVAIRRLDYDETIDSFTDKLFSQWYPTPEESSNQVLLVLDTLSNRTAIRTGEAVKNILPDAIAQSVASETAIAPLRQGSKYNQSFLDVSSRLTAVLSGENDPGPPVIEETVNIESNFTKAEDTDRGGSTIWVVVLLLLATIIPMVTYYWYVGLPGR
jgi:uncharacterized protein